jgi:hypothetical protein
MHITMDEVLSSSFGDSNQTHIHARIPTYVAGVTYSHVTGRVCMRPRVSPKNLSPKREVTGSHYGV